jgi:hypothetical protein
MPLQSVELIAVIRDMHAGISEVVGQLTEAHERTSRTEIEHFVIPITGRDASLCD